MKKPTFNHDRGDGPYDPCPECLELMTKKQLISLVKDLKSTIKDLKGKT